MMRLQLARSARRACPSLLAHQYLPPPPCPSTSRPRACSTLSCQRPRRPCTAHRLLPSDVPRTPGKRTFFGFLKKPPRDLKDAEIEPGYGILLQFSANQSDNERPPAREELLQAFTAFFRYKQKHRTPVNSTQALCALRVFSYLLDKPESPSFPGFRVLVSVQEALLRPPKDDHQFHLELSKEVYKEMRRRKPRSAQGFRRPQQAAETPAEQAPDSDGEVYWADFHKYITALAQYGAASEAVDELVKYHDGRPSIPQDTLLWMVVLRSIAAGDNEQLLLDAYATLQRLGVPYRSASIQEIMVGFYAGVGNSASLWEWVEKGTEDPTPKTYLELLRLALRHSQEEKRVNGEFLKLCNSEPGRALWDVVLQWAVSLLSKSLDDIKRLVATLAKHDKSYPDLATINVLIRTAADKKDPLMAERLVAWLPELQLVPDTHTYALQVGYRLDADDFSGAHEAFEKLMHSFEAAPDEEYHAVSSEVVAPAANKYLRVLSSAPEKLGGMRGGILLAVLGSVEEYRVALEAETVAALCIAFLRNDQQDELIDTLSLHTFQYSIEQRGVVRDALVAYCLDRANSTARVWDAYALLRQFFPETDRPSRELIMDAFFSKRRRPDMAVMVFGHMRAHGAPSIRPDAGLYARALTAIGKTGSAQGGRGGLADMMAGGGGATSRGDLTSLQTLHNMLKMDATVQPDTALYNALMIAYTGCGDPATALEYWREISDSPQGPSYNSLAAFFWTCEKLPFGDARARQVWAKMQRLEVEVPPFVFGAYLGAIAGNGNIEEVKTLLRNMTGSVGFAPDTSMLRIVYNALPGQALRADFEDWAKGEYPVLWGELETKVPRGKTLFDIPEFKHPRDDIQP